MVACCRRSSAGLSGTDTPQAADPWEEAADTAAAKRSQRRRSLVSSTSHTAGTRSATSHVLPRGQSTRSSIARIARAAGSARTASFA
jgi:hypothetical protein